MVNQIGIYDLSTDTNIVRDMTAEESAEYKTKIDEIAAQEQKKAAKEIQRNALLAKLGITQQEANLLLGISEEQLKTDSE